jgi:hypothetical protein
MNTINTDRASLRLLGSIQHLGQQPWLGLGIILGREGFYGDQPTPTVVPRCSY